MARETWRIIDGVMTLVYSDAPGFVPPVIERGEAPMVITDSMDAVRNHADGLFYDSKRAFEKAVRAKGFEIMGNEAPKYTPPPDPGRAFDRALRQAVQYHGGSSGE